MESSLSQISMLQNELNKLKEENNKKQQTAQNEKEETAKKLSDLQKQNQDLLEANKKLEQEKEAMESSLSQIDTLQNELNKLKEENEKLAQTVNTIKEADQEEPVTVPTDKEQSETETAQNTDLLEAYQEMKQKLEESTLHYPYTRITVETDGSQYIYESRSLQLKAELFIWGVEGKEVILDENHFIPYNEIAGIEGLETPFTTDTLLCDFSEDGNGEQVAEALLMAICSYHPIHITYRDKNGRISERNLYWLCFQPNESANIKLPYEKVFRDMFEGEIDAEHIMAMCAHNPVPRTFIINQIQSIRVFDAFVTTRKGIDAQIDGMYSAVRAAQSEAADMIYQYLPEKFKKLPAVISSRAHYWVLEGDYQKAMELYLSIAPDAEIAKGKTWAQANAAHFNELIENDVEAERFAQLKEALKEEGWTI